VWFESPTDGVRDAPKVEVVDPEGWKRERGWFDESRRMRTRMKMKMKMKRSKRSTGTRWMRS
jgi:hypothetical protein